MQKTEKVQNAVSAILALLGDRPVPKTGVILGSGLGEWLEAVDDLLEIPYADIVHFPRSTVTGHAGTLCLGTMHGVPVCMLRGRFHLYEGYTPQEVCFGVRVLAGLGIRNLILTNAAGALNPQFDAGSLMLITDHLNMTGLNPLTGPNEEAWGPRFPDMSRVYDQDLQRLARLEAATLGIPLERGVYVGIQGPSLETPAETRAFRILGGDAIGMSTVMEAVAARHMGLRILGLSCLTNKNLPDCMAETSLEEILEQAKAAGRDLGRVLAAVIAGIEHQ
ncbi:MAG TPA: purine-nucleoside phosphorylase [Desulfomicrobiaceae bacterium]|nr:purine-nucleoside phosphorylase [Desulfomicrobiaceae bacterium]